MKKTFLFLFSILTFYSFASAQKEGLTAIDQNDLKAYLTFFASDEMAGRETGRPENDAAALFIKANLMRLGLKPIPETGDYFQKIPMVSTFIDSKERFLKVFDAQDNQIFLTDSIVSLAPPATTLEFTGNIVFAGYAYSDTTGYNDLAGLNMKDKIVLFMTRTPKLAYSGEKSKMFDEQTEGPKFGRVFMSGPKAILIVYDPKNNFRDAYESGIAELIPSNSVSLSRPKGGGMPFQISFITKNAADQLLKPTGYTLSQMQERIKYEGKPVSQEISGIKATVKTAVGQKDFSANNVIGIIEGSDPVLKNECIVYSAHYDHVGINANGEAFNGADDNASGSMALLEVAEAFMKLKKPPLRTIVFAWVNGEEKGLLGSKYYTENPVITMENTVVDINLDMVGRSKMEADTGNFFGFDLDITEKGEINVFTNHESSELLQIMNTAAKEAGIKVNDKGSKIEYGSSDHANFIAKGVTALCFNSGVHSDLHKTGDDIGKIDFDKMEKSSKMCFLIGYRVANQKNRIVVDNPVKPD